jgi:hypothetical protein
VNAMMPSCASMATCLHMMILLKSSSPAFRTDVDVTTAPPRVPPIATRSAVRRRNDYGAPSGCVTQRSGLPRGPDLCRDRAHLVAPRAREVLRHGEAVGVGKVLVQFSDRVDAIDLDPKRSH